MKKILDFIARKEAIIGSICLAVPMVVWSLLKPDPESISTAVATTLLVSIAIISALVKNHKTHQDSNKEIWNVFSEVENLIYNLKPYTALETLDQVQIKISNEMLIEPAKSQILSRYHYLLGNCISDTKNDTLSGFEEFVKAYGYDQKSIKATEAAVMSFFFLDNVDKSLELAEQILSRDPYNIRSWTVKLVSGKIKLSEAPLNVRKKIDFKFIAGSFYIKRGFAEESRAILGEDLIAKDYESQIDRSNFKYYLLVASFWFSEVLHKYSLFTNHQYNSKLFGNSEIKEINIILKAVFEKFGKSELITNNDSYKQFYAVFYLTNYYLTENKADVFNCFHTLIQNSKHVHNGLLLQLSICLSHLNEREKLLEICENKSFKDNHDLILVKADFHFHQKELDEALNDFTRYYELFERIDSRLVRISINIFDIYVTKDENYDDFVQNALSKEFENDNSRKLFNSYISKGIKEKYEETFQEVDHLLQGFESLDHFEKLIVCRVLFHIEKHTQCREYLKNMISLEEETSELMFFIEVIYSLKLDHAEILEYLSKWNNDYQPNVLFLRREIELRYQQGDWKRIEFLANKGRVIFPDISYFLVNLCFALFRNDKHEQLRSLISKIERIDFDYQSAFHLVEVYSAINEHGFAINLAYQQVLRHPDNVVVKQSYFYALTGPNSRKEVPAPQIIEPDCTIRVKEQGIEKLLHINEESIQNNKIAPLFLQRRKGDVIKYVEPMTDSSIEFEVVQIMDKYTGKIAEITREIENSNKIDGYDIISFKAPTEDVEEFSKVMREKFGTQGEKRHMLIQDSFKQYESCKLSFTELVIRVDYENPLKLYEYLTTHGSGFRIPPISFFRDVDYSKIEEYVIDLSSLSIIYEFTKSSNVNKDKFIVSAFLIEHLKDKIRELESYDNQQLSLSIRLNQLDTHITNGKELKTTINKYNSYLKWVELNCRVEFSTEKLDLIAQSKEPSVDHWYMNYWVDTMLLANTDTRCLICNDELVHKQFFHLVRPMTSESFLMKKHENALVIAELHIKNNYLGIKLNEEALIRAFESTRIFEHNKLFKVCINNLDFKLHYDKQLIFEVVKFLKYLYSTGTNLKFKNSIAETLILESIKSYPLDRNFAAKFTQFLSNEFSLLPLELLEVMNMASKVFDILNFKTK